MNNKEQLMETLKFWEGEVNYTFEEILGYLRIYAKNGIITSTIIKEIEEHGYIFNSVSYCKVENKIYALMVKKRG